MKMVDIVLVLLYFTCIGWGVHKIMGKDGGALHYCFIGGVGSGLGALLEYVTGCYAATFLNVIGLSTVCGCVVEYVVRKIKHLLWVRKIHAKGWHTTDINTVDNITVS